jgi:hypothetical protein
VSHINEILNTLIERFRKNLRLVILQMVHLSAIRLGPGVEIGIIFGLDWDVLLLLENLGFHWPSCERVSLDEGATSDCSN